MYVFYSKVFKLTHRLLVMQPTNAVNERTLLCVRVVKKTPLYYEDKQHAK